MGVGIAPAGPKGEPGEADDGLSAYEVAVINGYSGSEAQWLASLVGPQGQAGPQGIPGDDGPQGDQGTQGNPGTPGDDGLSAYEVAVVEGFTGTEEEWLESLVGPPGVTTWGGLTGTLSNQTDLQTALDGKAASNHNHDAAYEAKNANIQAHIASAHAPSNAEQNVNADWDAVSGDAQILNKPSLAQLHDRQHSITSASDHTFPGGTTNFLREDGTFAAPTATVAAPFVGSQAPGSFTVGDGQFGIQGKRLSLTTTQRGTVAGSGRLIISG